MKPPPNNRDLERTLPPFRVSRWQQWRARVSNFHLRDSYWRMLDFFEASRAARFCLYLAAFGIVATGAGWYWAYPAWTKRNAVRVAMAWMEAGQLHYAAEAAQRAAAVDPTNPQPWLIAERLARLGGQQDQALEYARKAADLAPEDPAILTGLAAAALRADKGVETDEVLDRLPVEYQAASPHVQRMRGELARRGGRFTAARNFFEAARQLEGPAAINEVPLGLILLDATDPAERQRGLDLLGRWTADADWGATALRNLLGDALDRNDRTAMVRYAEQLRVHPGCLLTDMPNCLLGLSLGNPTRYRIALTALKNDHSVSPKAAAQLLSWLNQIGRGADGVAWMRSLPPVGMSQPPLAVVGAETLRQADDWSGLQAWTADGNWGKEANFLRWTYGMLAAHQLAELQPYNDLWATLKSHAALDGSHAVFAGSLLYGWGRVKEGTELWWIAAMQEGPVAIEALGSLARHYQMQRDAEGQYRVFRQLFLVHPQDRDIGNNYSFFATLTKRDERQAEQIARENLAAVPDNRNYRATLAFALVLGHHADEALHLLEPVTTEIAGSEALSFAYGLALAGVGRKAEAHTYLDPLPRASLTETEIQLIRTSLTD